MRTLPPERLPFVRLIKARLGVFILREQGRAPEAFPERGLTKKPHFVPKERVPPEIPEWQPRKGRDGMRALSREERLKYEVAQELGLLPKLREVGWAGLTTAESGRIGGLMGARLRQRKREFPSEGE
jgi:hypothetical protein